jgi:tetratricopeptide (TPR) repeat protein
MGLYLARQYDAAVRQFADAIDLGPELPQSHSFRGLALSAQGRHAEAIESLERAVRLARTDRGDRAVIAARLAYAYAKGGKRAQAVAVQDELRRSSGDRYVSPFSIAMIYAGLGEPAQAIDWLESGVNDDDRAVEMLFLKVDPRTDSLRADPRFQGLIRRIGF